MITIVDYGLGNIQAFANIYKRLNIACQVARSSKELSGADKIILPGVGAFDWAIQRLNQSGMRPMLDELVLKQHRPILGVCVGMQMMANRSDEGILPGLSWIDAEVNRFDESLIKQKTHLPHMEWNDVVMTSTNLFKGLVSPRFYFLHSYYVAVKDPILTIGTTNYNGLFTSAIANGHIFGVQFHPEKSHEWGIELLNNFANL